MTMTENAGMERYVGSALMLILLVGCIVVLRPFFSAVLWAVVLAYSTWPIYARILQRLHGRRSLAATAMITVAAAFLLVPLIALGSRLTAEVAQIMAVVREWTERGLPGLPDWVATLPLIGGRLNAYWTAVAADGAKLTGDLREYLPAIRDWVLQAGLSLTSGITDVLLSLLIAFFLYRDGAAMLRSARMVLVRVGGDTSHRLLAVAGRTITGVVYGVLGANLIQGLLAAIGLRIAGVPGALILGFALFFLTIIPFAAAIVFLPAILWLIHQGQTFSAIFLTVWYVIVFMILEGVIRAYFISRGGELPLILVLLGMLGGLIAFGLLGIFVGPTLLAIAHALAQEWTRDTAAGTETVASEQMLEPQRPPA